MRRPFLPVSLNLEGRICVVIGAEDDREAIDKAEMLDESGADLRWITDVAALRDEDLDDAYFVLSTPQDEALSARLRALADARGFLLCCIDQPKYGFVAMVAIAKAGPVRIAISTAGIAPRIAKIIKGALQDAMDATFERFVDVLARKRIATFEEHPGPEGQPERRAKLIEAADGFDARVRFAYPEWFDRER